MGSIETRLPGVRFGELLTDTAKIADKLSIVRSLSHGEAAHERGTHNMFHGLPAQPGPAYLHGQRGLARQLAAAPAPPYVSHPQPAHPDTRVRLPQRR